MADTLRTLGLAGLAALVAGCVGYHNPDHPCLDLSPETFCNSAVVQGSKAVLVGVNRAQEYGLREREVRALEEATRTQRAPAYMPVGQCVITCRPFGVDQVQCQQLCP